MAMHRSTEVTQFRRLNPARHFSSEELADYRGTSFAVGMGQLCQTRDGHRLLAADVPRALPTYQLPAVGTLSSSPPRR